MLQHLAGANGSGRIVGIDEDDAARLRRDPAVDVVEIGLPAVVFIEVISVQPNVNLRQNCRVERIVGARGEQVVAGIEQRSQANVDGLTHARSYEYILDGGDAIAGGFSANGVEGLRNAGRGRVPVLAVAHRLIDGFDQVGRRLKIEIEWIADVERQNFVSLASDLVGNAGQVADGVADVFQTRGRENFAGLRHGHKGARFPPRL